MRGVMSIVYATQLSEFQTYFTIVIFSVCLLFPFAVSFGADLLLLLVQCLEVDGRVTGGIAASLPIPIVVSIIRPDGSPAVLLSPQFTL